MCQTKLMANSISIGQFLSQQKGCNLSQWKILIVGVGGLGCELLKCCLFSGLTDLEIIDMDSIELSNLNRQFLFRQSDIGKSKAEVAARYFNDRAMKSKKKINPIVPHFCSIQEKDASFYKRFDVIISGLDSIEARRWLNSMLHSLLEFDSDGSVISSSVVPLIDGGTEGFKGSVRVIIPGFTACFECTIGLFPPATKVAICTLSNKPRKFDHCLEYASLVEWKESDRGKDVPFDAEIPEHVNWVIERAVARAKIFSLPVSTEETTFRSALKTLKNIIPAISSTNAIIAAMCCNEVIKLAGEIGSSLNNFFLYNGTEGVYSNSFENERLPECIVCSRTPIIPLEGVTKECSVLEFVEKIQLKFSLKAPTIRNATQNIYFTSVSAMMELNEENSSKKIWDFEGPFWICDSSLLQVLCLQLK